MTDILECEIRHPRSCELSRCGERLSGIVRERIGYLVRSLR